MSRRNIHIEKLQIRLPKGAGASARRLADGLGGEILRQIAQATRQRTGVQKIGAVDAGKIKNSNGAELSKQIARRVAAIVGEKTK